MNRPSLTLLHFEYPDTTYLYRLGDANGKLLYVGISNHWLNRIRQHSKTKDWFPNVATVSVAKFPDRSMALANEREVIWREAPRYNQIHNRGYSYFGGPQQSGPSPDGAA